MPLEGGGCGGEWRYPRQCSPKNGTCEYRIKWQYKKREVNLENFKSICFFFNFVKDFRGLISILILI